MHFLAPPDAACGKSHASVVEDAHGDFEALADAADDVLDGHLHVVEM